MSFIGPFGWDNNYNYVSQTNNPTESFLGKMKIIVPGVTPLQSCGPSSSTIGSAIKVGYDKIVPKNRGEYKAQPEEMLMDFFQDTRFTDKFLAIRSDYKWKSTPFNEVPQYYPYAVKMVFNVDAEFTWASSMVDVIGYLRNGWPVQICLKNPGHYILAAAYDMDNDEIRYHDPWPGRHADGNGFNRIMTRKEFESNVKPFAIVYKGSL